LYDNRLLPLASREYQFAYRLPANEQGLKVRTRVQYHIVTDKQHEMLQHKYGLTGNDPYRFLIYEREFPLSEQLGAALATGEQYPHAASADSQSCSVEASGSAAGSS
jgi:hypothetical protein